MENNQSFWQFSDQLRHQTSNFSNLSLNDSIWSNSYGTKRSGERKNFDMRVGGDVNSLNNIDLKGSDLNGFNVNWESSLKAKASDSTGFNDGWNSFKPKTTEFNGFNDGWSNFKGKSSDLNVLNDGWSNFKGKSSELNVLNDGWSNFKGKSSDLNVLNDGWSNFKGKSSDLNVLNDGWKIGTTGIGPGPGPIFNGGSQIQKSVGINGGFNKGIFSKPTSYNINNNLNLKGYKNSGKSEDDYGVKGGKKNNNKKHYNENSNNENKDSKNASDKRFKTLPASESLPRNETIGGYIFVCNNDTMQENLQRQLFGLPPRYRDSVRAITPGLPLFLYNYSTHQLHGVFEASSFGGTNIDPTAWEDKKCSGESRFPAQVKVVTRKIHDPLEEDSFRPILHHYDGPKFRLELNVPEALSLLDVFAEQENL